MEMPVIPSLNCEFEVDGVVRGWSRMDFGEGEPHPTAIHCPLVPLFFVTRMEGYRRTIPPGYSALLCLVVEYSYSTTSTSISMRTQWLSMFLQPVPIKPG